jgi:acetyltransferase-like isoleucine patch superfamily enzyme
VKRLLYSIACCIPVLRDILRTSGTTAPITLGGLFAQKVLGFNRKAYWPMHFTSYVSNPRLVRLGIGTAPGDSKGCYIQSNNGIEIGDYTMLAPNVGLISANHNPSDLSDHVSADPIRIGRYCWIGMNAVILPGVTVGDHTVVGAGAVVTDSFPEGYCVVGGVPARLIKRLDKTRVAEHRNRYEYIGFHFVGARNKHELLEELKVTGL